MSHQTFLFVSQMKAYNNFLNENISQHVYLSNGESRVYIYYS